ncbi:hypothetical protein ACOSP7_031308 [Xanthoceras sorbifolium]
MTLNLCVLTPNRIVWDSEVKEIILSTNSRQIGVLPNHAPIATVVDIGNFEFTILVNDAEKSSDIDSQEAQQTLERTEASLRKAESKRQTIEANLALKRARTRVEQSPLRILGTTIIGGTIPKPKDALESFRLLVRELRSLALELNKFHVFEKNFQINKKEA